MKPAGLFLRTALASAKSLKFISRLFCINYVSFLNKGIYSEFQGNPKGVTQMQNKTAGPDTAVPIAKYIGSRATATEKQNPDWSAVVARIREGDQSAEVELYQVFSRGIRFFIMRQLGAEGLEDNVHDCFIETLKAIRKGQLQDPQRLMGFVRTIVRRKIAESIGMRVVERSRLCSFEESFVANIPHAGAGPESLEGTLTASTRGRSEDAEARAGYSDAFLRYGSTKGADLRRNETD